MEMPQRQLEQPREQKLSPARRPRFSATLLERETSKFIDPAAEAAIVLPQREVASAPIAIELEKLASAQQEVRAAVQKQNALSSSIYVLLDFLATIFAKVKKRLKGKRARQKITKDGQQALDQLRYLAALCDATSCRTPEEILEAESAFGEAYYEIMNLSANLERMSEKEQSHHLRRYSKHMSRLLSVAD
ncbi:MAG: hypothetical protein NTV88_04475 [Candidatus Micrarchaeota archaeon]|nr:hypothetical protein [Candidatus Micrarchaeota archaeon]